ncbi:MAG: hypothetical protein WCY37_04995 [Candidatus Dojkabacteria bacterium]
MKRKELSKIEINRAIGGYSVEVRYDGFVYETKSYIFKKGEEQEMLEFMIKLLNNKKLGIVEID